MKRHSYLAALLITGALAACSMDKNAVQSITEAPPATSRIRFFNFGVNAPSVNFYANETKMTAVNSATGVEATTGVGYGGVGSGGNYTAIAPGQYTLSGRIAATTDKDKPISNLPATIEDGKFYSFYQSGFYDATAKTIDGFIVEDNYTLPTDPTMATIRFVNAISNSQPMILYIKNTATGSTVQQIGGATPYKGATAFVTVPSAGYDVSTRLVGSSTDLMTRTALGFAPGRAYTITARGDITVAATPTTCASTNKTCLDLTEHR